jgi:hypothetical protein
MIKQDSTGSYLLKSGCLLIKFVIVGSTIETSQFLYGKTTVESVDASSARTASVNALLTQMDLVLSILKSSNNEKSSLVGN